MIWLEVSDGKTLVALDASKRSLNSLIHLVPKKQKYCHVLIIKKYLFQKMLTKEMYSKFTHFQYRYFWHDIEITPHSAWSPTLMTCSSTLLYGSHSPCSRSWKKGSRVFF